MRFVLGVRIRDIDCAFKVFNRGVFDKVQIQSVGAMVNTEIFAQVFRFGMRVKEVPVSHFPRRHGKPTGGDIAVIMKAFRELVKIRRKQHAVSKVIRRLRRLQARQQRCAESIASETPAVQKIFASADSLEVK